ncbi:homoserine O-succinyltransferase [Lysobacter pythonis]|uniref:Homoserine O-succinyltransferase n=1 Tax=Solilutibacter pythonis TaxID=2483112 RepID=A0A3M2HR12_9GAMM|nr:homoserine O-succinyltransferase [Lysobacter pythonis]RMH88637.1 homoserine O-succinyltransferase [Lysobacter pythonis]
MSLVAASFDSSHDEAACRFVGAAAAEPLALRGVHRCRLALRHAGERDVAIRWELSGPADAPLLIVAGGISAHRHVIANELDAAPGWWQAQAGLLGRHRVLAIDWLGDGDGLDVAIDSADQADALAAVIAALDLPRAHAFIGASYGAMVGLHFAACHAGKLGALVAISGGHRPHPWSSALRSVQRKIVTLGDDGAGLALARQLAMLSYRTPAEFAERFAAPVELREARAVCPAEDYLESCGQRVLARFDAASYVRLSQSIDLHRIEPERVRVPLSVIAVDSDLLVPREDLAELAVRAPDAWLQVIASRYGHDAFLKETTAISAALTAALDA